jgi:NAD(P)-dependent dehydrogenase (short-subunit alcohol dehydrogenase family)
MLLPGSVSAMSLFRPELLTGRRIAVSGGIAGEVSEGLIELGAELEALSSSDLSFDEGQVGEWARARRPLHALVHCAARSFGSGGEPALLAALDDAWAAIREVAVGALIDAGHTGAVVVVGPRPNAGPLAEAARSGLENLARTLSVEWARHGVTSVLVAPGAGTSESDLTSVVGFLVSDAGGYLSGCRLDLGAVS